MRTPEGSVYSAMPIMACTGPIIDRIAIGLKPKKSKGHNKSYGHKKIIVNSSKELCYTSGMVDENKIK